MTPEDIAHLILNNVWILLASTIGIFFIIMADVGTPLYHYFRQPKFQYLPMVKQEEIKYLNEYDYHRENFYIFVKNSGKELAEDCYARIKITDKSGRLIAVRSGESHNIEDNFKIPWTNEDGSIDTMPTDLMPSNQYEKSIKIPIFMILAKKEDDVLGDKHLPSFVMKIEGNTREPRPDLTLGDHEHATVSIGIEVFIVSRSRSTKKRFNITIEKILPVVYPAFQVHFKQRSRFSFLDIR